MTEQQMPARISHGFVCGVDYISAPYVHSDIAERMAEALEKLLDASERHIFSTECQIERDNARSALSAFKDSAQDRGAS